jgi:hypothetical protein
MSGKAAPAVQEAGLFSGFLVEEFKTQCSPTSRLGAAAISNDERTKL